MSTRSLINVQCLDGKIRSIYVHFDGDSHLETLQKYYNTQDQAELLVSLGDLSILAERIAPKMGENHSFDNPIKGICVAYYRDRGENWDDENPKYTPYQEICKAFGVMPFDNPCKKDGCGFREFNSFEKAWKQDRGQEYIYEWSIDALGRSGWSKYKYNGKKRPIMYSAS